MFLAKFPNATVIIFCFDSNGMHIAFVLQILYPFLLLYEALQDQSTAVPIMVHMALWYIVAEP